MNFFHCVFKKNNQILIKNENILKISCFKNEEANDKCSVCVRIDNDFASYNQADECEILRGSVLLFKGDIKLRTNTNKKYTTFHLQKKIEENQMINNDELKNSIVEKFQNENPNLKVATSKKIMSNNGDLVEVSLIAPNDLQKIIKNISSKMIKNSLKQSKDFTKQIKELNLNLNCMWVAKRAGDSDLSTRLENNFKFGKINTITPRNFLAAWPNFGEKLRSVSSARQSKYFFGKSRIIQEVSKTVKIKTNIENVNNFNVNHVFITSLLGISWEYDQLVNENITLKIKNNLASNGSSTSLKIDLKNVQEYVEDPYEKNFFTTKNGKLILSELSKFIINYIILSMRYEEIEFDSIVDSQTLCYDCSNFIEFEDKIYKIYEIITNLDGNTKEMKIKAVSVPGNLKFLENSLFDFDLIEKSLAFNEKEIGDIIQDIVVKNEGIDQIEKLQSFIKSEQKNLNKNNYKKNITNYLNSIKTEIQIITNPLKTQHCEQKTINLNEISVF